MWKNVVSFIMIEVGSAGLGQLLPESWMNQVPSWALVLVIIICYGTPILLLMPKRFRELLWSRVHFTPPVIEWKHVAVGAAIIVLIQFAAINRDYIFGLWDSLPRLSGLLLRLGPEPARTGPLFTRPICESDCENFGFIVRECELQSAQVGGLAYGRDIRSDVVGATEFFRGCLISQGLSWVPCDRGDPECRMLYRYPAGRDGVVGRLPSFIAR